MPFRTPTGGVLLSRPHRGLLMALIAAVMLAVVPPVTVDASTSRGSAGPAGPGQPPIGWTTCGSGLESRTCQCRWTGVTPMAPPSRWR
jgi:hypothetical protein